MEDQNEDESPKKNTLWQPTGQMRHALATPTPGLMKGGKVPIHHVTLP
ncbi:hypothetical protein L345_03449 [Ophiophagus hannah]|uniref:Uncharacterized protein n=1 Tax=Ophiophagus hannah TaxID=8665 RepID=V8P8S6_OPHHA|nr:hypothetical protein L345_03449 [Ophiophagus hannah]